MDMQSETSRSFRVLLASFVAALCVLSPPAAGHAGSFISGQELAYGGTAPVNDVPVWPSDDEVPSSASGEEDPGEWNSLLPIGGEKAHQRGYELPLPIGVSVGMMHMLRDVEVTRVAVGTSGEADLDVSNIVSGTVGTEVTNVNLRVDAWLLPFLNVYALVGHTFNTSDVLLRFKLPNREIEVRAPGGFDGPTWGVGGVLAGGYEWWFVTVDATWAKTKLDGFDAAIATRVFSGRSGWNGELWGHPTRLWLGVTYWDTEREMQGEVPLPEGGALSFDVTQGPVNPWNPTIGGNFEISKTFNFVLDYGDNFDDARTLIASFNARF